MVNGTWLDSQLKYKLKNQSHNKCNNTSEINQFICDYCCVTDCCCCSDSLPFVTRSLLHLQKSDARNTMSVLRNITCAIGGLAGIQYNKSTDIQIQNVFNFKQILYRNYMLSVQLLYYVICVVFVTMIARGERLFNSREQRVYCARYITSVHRDYVNRKVI